jgi:hypothetical protein
MMFKSSACIEHCPTGVEGNDKDDMLRCDKSFEAVGSRTLAIYNKHFNFNEQFNLNHSVPDKNIFLHGGSLYGGTFDSDPLPIKDRGTWFDGKTSFLVMNQMMLDHTFTMAFFIRSFVLYNEEGLLYGIYKQPDQIAKDNISLFSFSLRFEKLVFHD